MPDSHQKSIPDGFWSFGNNSGFEKIAKLPKNDDFLNKCRSHGPVAPPLIPMVLVDEVAENGFQKTKYRVVFLKCRF